MTLIGRDICVVGAGISGLAAARALAMRGASVTVLERAAEILEVGAGIQISPNGGRVLEALGLGSAFEHVSIQSEAVELCDDTGRPVLRMGLDGRGRFGLVHRADLIDVLLEGAREAGVSIVTGAGVRSLERVSEGAQLTIEDGSLRVASLVVGADGLHSRVRAVLEGESAPEFTGQVAWRAVIEAPSDIPNAARVFMAPGRHVVAYPLRDGRRLNLVAVEERAAWADEGWHHKGAPDDLRKAFSGFSPPVGDWLDQVQRCMVWGLFKHPVAERWWQPGMVMLGDAAHPTLPFLAQGACMALEDAWCLARALSEYEDDSSALAAFQATRKPRVERIVAAATANARNYHLGGAKRVVAHAGLRAINAISPSFMLGRFDWLYGFDPTV